MPCKIIAIDGPAGAGKSTVARVVAKKLGYIYLDTGAIYRAITLKAIENNADINNAEEIANLAVNSDIDLKTDSQGNLKVFLDDKDVTKDIRSPKVNKFVSDVAKIPEVRKSLLSLQHSFAKKYNIVLEGRDTTTVVFPNADKKFYIDAKQDERIKRRWKELKEVFQDISSEEVEKDLTNRDYIDSTRKTAPLQLAKDAIYIDTTNMSIEEVVSAVLNNINQL